jgi:hypothetical protein
MLDRMMYITRVLNCNVCGGFPFPCVLAPQRPGPTGAIGHGRLRHMVGPHDSCTAMNASKCTEFGTRNLPAITDALC